MLRHALIAILAAAPALAETPNIVSGEWEFDNETSFEGDIAIPAETETARECIRAEEIEQGFLQVDDTPGMSCDIAEQQVARDGMSYTMTCTGPDGESFDIDADISFMGERASGIFTGRIESAMGTVDMTQTMEGRRIGDC